MLKEPWDAKAVSQDFEAPIYSSKRVFPYGTASYG